MANIPLSEKMRLKHRSEGGFCRACRTRMKYPCDMMRLVIERDALSSMVRAAKKILQEIGTMSVRRLDK